MSFRFCSYEKHYISKIKTLVIFPVFIAGDVANYLLGLFSFCTKRKE